MRTGSGRQAAQAEGAGGGGSAGDAWQAIRADGDIQFAPVTLPPTPETPGWLERLMALAAELLAPPARFVAANWSAIWPLLAGAAALLALYAIARLVAPGLGRRRPSPQEVAWRPDQQAALTLLEEADRLAAHGRYDEATHLLLVRSVGQIAALRPELVEPSSTAREIAALADLPAAGRRAFATIAGRVEQSLFALRRLTAEDWQAARAAYAEFAAVAERRLAG